MGVEVRPVGVQCNIACQYCYQNVLRDAGWQAERADIEAIKATIREVGEPFHLFGGEPLLLPIAELEELFRWGAAEYQTNGIQTNGVLITERHIEIFARYDVRVGISIDGPGRLNDARWAGSLERTRTATVATLASIRRLCEAGRPPALMLQITRCNGIAERLEELCAWLLEMQALGVKYARIHILEIDNAELREHYALSIAENIAAFERMAALGRELTTLRLDCNHDKRLMLMMQDEDVACVWRGCDPLSTDAVLGVGSRGERHKCGLTDKEGVNFLRPERAGYERYLALYHTPQAFGGCQGCRFFLGCKGQCPGTGIDGDWRNRSENCEVWKALFSRAEADLVAEGRTPVSLHPEREAIERRLIEAWAAGTNPTLSELRRSYGLELGGSVEEWSRE
ncbi:radical SAM protein [Sorangium sp. So ce185]|uniref:radical SAM protein n=1 Tax=Sorangium sp. So ce185 TaxID=3133287 RepID=UPI003F5E3893